MSPDLDQRFAQLAVHAHQTARQATAEEVRRRGNRLRWRRRLVLLLLTAVAAATLLLGLLGTRAAGDVLGAGRAVDAFAQQVGVAVVPGVLLDHV